MYLDLKSVKSGWKTCCRTDTKRNCVQLCSVQCALNACRTRNYMQRSQLIGLIIRYARNSYKIDQTFKYVTWLLLVKC